MSDAASALTIRHAQTHQPWTVPYSNGVMRAAKADGPNAESVESAAIVPHILGSHCVLRAAKSIGKIAAVYELRDHDPDDDWADGKIREVRRNQIRAAAADLMTAALRFANLEGFDLAEALIERVQEKNGTGYPALVIEELQPGEAPRAFQPHVAEKRYVLIEIHEKDAYVEDQQLIGETFVRGTEWESPHAGYLSGMFKRLPGGETFTFLAAKFEAQQ
jgi:hypothetical protein